MKRTAIVLLFLMGFLMCFAQEKETKTETKSEKETEKETKTTFNFGGFIKLSYLNTWYMNGDPSQTNPIREFNFPAYIPVGPDDQNFNMDVNAKETRLHFEVKTVLLKKEIRGYIEMDFMFSKAGDDKVSNGYNPRLRHAFFEFDKFLIGQSWSTFMIVLVPDDIDFAAALEGMVFVIQPQIRYKAGSWWFALENPGTFNAPYQGSTTEVADADFIPDVTVRKNFEGDWGSWSIAAIGRALHKSDSITSSTYGFGISTGGKIKTGERGDDFRILATYGSGIGRYQASAFNPDAVLNQDNQLKPINTLNGYIAYNHFWKPEKLSSSFNIGAYKAFHDENLVSPNINAVTYSASANIKWDPVRQVRFGVEYIYSYRGLEGDTNGAYHRIQLAAKYYFNYRNSIMNEKR